ncbi:auxin-responsive protein SAUR36-like [Andrographis paniculata]|uniref:auxin-responsive protein SAUR36-like n=1 Tax=Andrographis paniculata TaxID=175694 RepID=UPI0021E86971|nr:auxin-responsive protein SAUR36-like [Andrographis paniculata]
MGRELRLKIKLRVDTLFRRAFSRKVSPAEIYGGIDLAATAPAKKPCSRLVKWTRAIKTKAKRILFGGDSGSGLGLNPIPRGYVAVWVGQTAGERVRVLVPVVHLNHPWFGDLLKKSEMEFGFEHDGGIIFPCRLSEFERLQHRIAAAIQCRRRKLLPWKRNTSFRSC